MGSKHCKKNVLQIAFFFVKAFLKRFLTDPDKHCCPLFIYLFMPPLSFRAFLI